MNKAYPMRTRLERFLYGEFVIEDLTHILLYLRDKSCGKDTVREVGDFVVHFGERDRGPSTDLAQNFFTLFRFAALLMTAKTSSPASVNVPRDVLPAAFKSLDPEVIRREATLKPSVARKVFASLMSKFDAVRGTINSLRLKPAFDGERLIAEVGVVLQKNKLLDHSEIKILREKAPLILLHAVAHMHQCDLQLDGGPPATLVASRSDGSLQVIARAPCPTKEIPTLHFSGPLFKTGLRADDWCETDLLAGNPGQDKWDFPIELGPNQKLRKIVGR